MAENKSQKIEALQEELEKQLFQLKNLSDISRDLYLTTDFKKAVKDFLLMCMGSFGVSSTFVLIQGDIEDIPDHFLAQGLRGEETAAVREAGRRFLEDWDGKFSVTDTSQAEHASLRSLDIAVLLPFRIDHEATGLLVLGPKLSEASFDPHDKEVIEILGSNLAVALRNARSFNNVQRLNKRLTEQNIRLEAVLGELDRKIYHLKTLFDVSKNIFGSVNVAEIVRHFLLLTMGNFGAYTGFVSLAEAPFSEITHFESQGYKDDILDDRKDVLLKALQSWLVSAESYRTYVTDLVADMSLRVVFGLPFRVDDHCIGMLCLGPKLVGDKFSEDDKELLETLINNLVPALRNARAFENIQKLNMDLQEANIQLKKTLEDLRAALRKVEILEGIKSNLSKFVPTAVSRMIEASDAHALDAKERDVSVLFLDIEEYTRISERLDLAELNRLVERYFSVFMDAIYENDGDVNETAGDGLMVIFFGETKTAHAVNAVRTALSIREKTAAISREFAGISEPVIVNMGICSGPAFVGAVKFESYTGSRWTYTSRGMTTNLAARICGCAQSGQILLSRETAERVKDYLSCSSLGKVSLKNISEEVEIFSVGSQPLQQVHENRKPATM